MQSSGITRREARLCAGIAIVGLGGFGGLVWLLSATAFARMVWRYQPLGIALAVLAGQAALATLIALALWAGHVGGRGSRGV